VDEGPGKVLGFYQTPHSDCLKDSVVCLWCWPHKQRRGEMTQNFWNLLETDLTHSLNFQLDRKEIL